MTMYYSSYADDFLIGKAAEVFILKSATNILPSEMMIKGKFYSIGRIIQLLEVQCDMLVFKCLLKINLFDLPNHELK